jgi:hypothetical protein
VRSTQEHFVRETDMDKLIAAYAPRLMRPNPINYALAEKSVIGVRADWFYPQLARIGFE